LDALKYEFSRYCLVVVSTTEGLAEGRKLAGEDGQFYLTWIARLTYPVELCFVKAVVVTENASQSVTQRSSMKLERTSSHTSIFKFGPYYA
jgi:hypothetical protein